MTPTASELAAKTAAATARRERENKAREQAKQQARRDRAAAAMADVDATLRSIQRGMAAAAEDGRRKYQYEGPQKSWRKEDEDYLIVHKPKFDEVVRRLREDGFDAHHTTHTETEYYSDGAGPGATNIVVKVSW